MSYLLYDWNYYHFLIRVGTAQDVQPSVSTRGTVVMCFNYVFVNCNLWCQKYYPIHPQGSHHSIFNRKRNELRKKIIEILYNK